MNGCKLCNAQPAITCCKADLSCRIITLLISKCLLHITSSLKVTAFRDETKLALHYNHYLDVFIWITRMTITIIIIVSELHQMIHNILKIFYFLTIRTFKLLIVTKLSQEKHDRWPLFFSVNALLQKYESLSEKF